MNEEFAEKYRFSSWGTRRALEESVLLKGFAPWAEDCLNWDRQRHRRLQETSSWQLTRMFWANPDDPDSLVLMEIRESASAAGARKCLLDVLADDAASHLPEGPNDVGDVCFVHPEGTPPSIFWVTGNLCLSVVSLGLNRLRVEDWGLRLHERIVEKPPVRRPELDLTPAEARMRLDREQSVRFTPSRVLGEGGYTKFFVTGAEPRLEKDGLRLRAARRAKVVVEVFEVEPGQPPAAGRLELSAH